MPCWEAHTWLRGHIWLVVICAFLEIQANVAIRRLLWVISSNKPYELFQDLIQMCPLQARIWRKCAPFKFLRFKSNFLDLRTFVSNLALRRFRFGQNLVVGGTKNILMDRGVTRPWAISKWKHRSYVAIQWGFSVGIFQKKCWHTFPSCQLHSAPELTLAHDQHMTTVVKFQ